MERSRKGRRKRQEKKKEGRKKKEFSGQKLVEKVGKPCLALNFQKQGEL